MIKIIFKSLDSSELAKEVTKDRITGLIEKFPELNKSKITVTLEMENSPFKKGPDVFSVRIYINHGLYDGIYMKKSAPNFYEALAILIDHMLERLNRSSDRTRVKNRHRARKMEVRNYTY